MFKLASSIGIALALADLKRRVRHFLRAGAVGLAGAILAVFALAFLLVAAHLYLSGLLNPIASAAIIGGVLLVIALILFFVASRPLKPASAPRVEANPAAGLGDTIGESLSRLSQAAGSDGSPLRNPIFQAAGLALIAGFFFGRRSKRDKGD